MGTRVGGNPPHPHPPGRALPVEYPSGSAGEKPGLSAAASHTPTPPPGLQGLSEGTGLPSHPPHLSPLGTDTSTRRWLSSCGSRKLSTRGRGSGSAAAVLYSAPWSCSSWKRVGVCVVAAR